MDRDLRACQETGRSLDRAGEFQVVGNATTAEEVEQVVAVDDLDFVVASRDLPTGEILEVCRWIREHHEDRPPHVIVTGLPPDEDVILRYLEAGAAGFTLEEFSVGGLRLVMRLIARGESVFPLRLQHLMALRVSELAELVRERGLEPDLLGSLTRREMEVLELLERNLTNREIAERLYVSEGTVKSHVHQVLKKLRAGDRKEAVRVLRLQRVAPGRLAAMMEAQKEKEKERG
jgi:two-component system NarL family response regulator